MPPIGLAVPSPGRGAHVQIDGVSRHGLEQMENVQPQDHLRPVTPFKTDVASIPEMVPLQHMTLQKLIESLCVSDRIRRIQGGLCDGKIPGGEKGNNLLDRYRLFFGHVDQKFLADVSVVHKQLAFNLDQFLLAIHPDPGGYGHPQLGLTGLHQ
jgi:hypothetical protein